ncbi:mitochondrial carrier protein [Nitzschia inconspicua]|uniref:Mitochondrial carrier protein n=1 Tax=Nitzschia inconspicua TaxID=303405 RepID=A0A9K3PVN2_9STRA|nr:mitochondrial carrier protein [Nitzschia inconspicua]
MRGGKSVNILASVRVAGFFFLSLQLLISESCAYVYGGRHLLKTTISPSVRPLHLLNVNRVTRKRNKPTAEHCALSNPRHHSSWDSFLIPSSTALQPRHRSHDHITTLDKTLVAGFIGVFATFLYKFVMNSSPGSWRYFLAGGLCAASSHAIPTPIDVIKTRKQVDLRLADISFFAAGRDIIKEEGFGALWAGLGPTYWGYLLEGAVKFGVYEVLKPSMTSWLSRIAAATSITIFSSSLLAFVLSGVVSGVAASMVLCPMEALRIRLVAEPAFASGGWIQGGYKILQKEGVYGFSKGFAPMILKQVPYTVTKNVSFDVITKLLYSSLRKAEVTVSGTIMFAVPLLSAGIASVLSSISSQPGDMVLSLVNAHEGNLKTKDVWRSIMQGDRGFRGFFIGGKTRLLHVGVIVTIQLLIYDYVKRLCGIAATGSC